MAIKTGDKLPEATFMVMTAEGPAAKTVADVFSGKKVALFGCGDQVGKGSQYSQLSNLMNFDEFIAKSIVDCRILY